jgi:Siphovirus protein of unknown function (DUF859)/Fibronectin type III domain
LASLTVNVSAHGRLVITVDTLSQDQIGNTSQVRVRGWMYNDSSSTVSRVDAVPAVTRHISGYLAYDPDKFNFSIAAGDNLVFIDHTFTIDHKPDGTRTVTFTVDYGTTKTTVFGDDKSATITVVLTQIPRRPSPPGTPTFSGIGANTITVSWAASQPNGSAIIAYQLRRFAGTSPVGAYTEFHTSSGTQTSLTLTDAQAGSGHTYIVRAVNTALDNGGYSDFSNPAYASLWAAAYIRVGGAWKVAVPYIRVNGRWKRASPFVRSDGVWKPTG